MISRPQPVGRRLVPPRRWPRRILIGANVVVLMALVGTMTAFGYVRYRLADIRTGSGVNLTTSHGGQPENILLIGNETRAGQTQVSFGSATELTGTLSDVIMVLHLDPATQRASILSIPRDVFEPMPAGSPTGPAQKIDAALNDGAQGPNNLAAAISQDLGITINHYVEVDFDGFLDTVNALGGIRVDFPERLYDLEAGLNIERTGCQLLNGQQALALVRSRHLQYDPPGEETSDPTYWPSEAASDLARITRDHTFVRVLASTAESGALTNPIRANNFLGAVLNQLTIDPQLKDQLLSLVKTYHDLNPADAPESTIPVTQVLGADNEGYLYGQSNVGDVEFPDEPADLQAIEQWDPTALPKPSMPSGVEVINDAGSSDLAARTAASLQADGFAVTGTGNGQVPANVVETVVQYHPGQEAMGMAVFTKLSGAVTLQSSATVAPGSVTVDAGTTFSVDPPAGAAAPAAGATATSTSTPAASAPTPGGQAASTSADHETPYDPEPC